MIWLMILVVAVLVAINVFFLRGEDLRSYDQPQPERIGGDREPSSGHLLAVQSWGEVSSAIEGTSRKQQLPIMRELMDAMGEGVEFDGTITPVDTGTIRGEWIVARGADPARRLLYIHGGAFVSGSPFSHRAITTEYARRLGGAVFALDYRLMPEHSRQDGIDDCRAAYRWILDTGPQGPGRAGRLFVSGDSAGGNLSLSLSAWVRDQGLPLPNGVIALSPATDGTLSGGSIKSNLATDHMLGPMFGHLSKIPRFLLGLSALLTQRIPPVRPSVSPVFGDLSGLPPTLLHVSAHEMLYDDSVRYVNKARAAGSPVEIQAWGHMLHVWHIFIRDDLPEAQEAFAQIGAFLDAHASPVPGEAAA